MRHEAAHASQFQPTHRAYFRDGSKAALTVPTGILSKQFSEIQNDPTLDHLIKFYSIIALLEPGVLKLAACTGRMNWPKRGVYFFRESTQIRAESGNGPTPKSWTQ